MYITPVGFKGKTGWGRSGRRLIAFRRSSSGRRSGTSCASDSVEISSAALELARVELRGTVEANPVER